MGNEQPQAPKPKPLNPNELQTYLMVTQVKLNQGRNKKIALIKKKQDEIIKHLNDNNLDIAKAKMESLMREEDYITVYDILGPLCEILKEKVTYIMTSKECPLDLRASLDTMIYASTRLEIEELHMIREFIKQKYTNIYVDKANSNIDKLVNINVVDKLTVKPYPEAEIICRLKSICEKENIDFSFPQLSNPLIVDPNLNNKTVIPTIPNFNINDQGQISPGYPSTGSNFNNMNMNMNNMMPGYGMPMGGNFPQQQNYNYPGQTGQFPAMNPYANTNPNNNFNNPNYSNYPQMQNFNKPNMGPSDSSGSGENFNTIPNNFSSNPNPNQQQTGGNFPSYPNNPMIPPMNNNFNNSNSNGFPLQGKIEGTSMMSGGYPPMANTTPDQLNNSQGFPTFKNPNFSNMDDLEFPSSGGFPKKQN